MRHGTRQPPRNHPKKTPVNMISKQEGYLQLIPPIVEFSVLVTHRVFSTLSMPMTKLQMIKLKEQPNHCK